MELYMYTGCHWSPCGDIASCNVAHQMAGEYANPIKVEDNNGALLFITLSAKAYL